MRRGVRAWRVSHAQPRVRQPRVISGEYEHLLSRRGACTWRGMFVWPQRHTASACTLPVHKHR
jgi:hypothetical protein